MDSSTDNSEQSSPQPTNAAVATYEQLIEKYYALAQECAALETKQLDSESSDSVRYSEMIDEMVGLETELAETLNTFDEHDYTALFRRMNK